jgi:hypothetical protein
MSAFGSTTYANSLLLTPSRTQFEWQGWTITIQHLAFKKAVKQNYGAVALPLIARLVFTVSRLTSDTCTRQGSNLQPCGPKS